MGKRSIMQESRGYRLLRAASNMKCAISFFAIFICVVGLGIFGVYIFSKSNELVICPSTSFKCTEENKCVHFRYLCDGRPDCSKGSDELAMYCSDLSNLKMIFDNAMKLNFTLKFVNNATKPKLTLVSNDDSDGNSSSTPCGVREPLIGCQCKSVYVFCQETYWPSDFDWTNIPANTTRLAIRSGFTLDMKVWNVLPMTHMENLNVLAVEHHSNALNFTWTFIQNRRNLSKLYLTNNGITDLKAGDFDGFPKLEWLFLSDNKIDQLNPEAFAQLDNLIVLDLSYNRISTAGLSGSARFRNLLTLQQLYLHGNKIHTIEKYTFTELTKLQFLNLAHNQLDTIDRHSFDGLNLTEVDLSRNQLQEFDPQLFKGLKYLSKLSLGSNPVDWISGEIFKGKWWLISLDLREIELKNIDMEIFSRLPGLEFVFFKKFEYCRYVPRVPKCRPTTDGFSSVKNLINGTYLRISLWIIGIITLIGNSVVLTNRCFSRNQAPRLVLDAFINNLAAADGMMGLYFITIAIKDVEYRGMYNANAYKWTTSFLCTTIGTLAMVSRETSLLILTAMSMERYLVINGPYSFQRLTKKLAFLATTLIWTLGVIIGLVPVIIPGLRHAFYGSSGLCFSLHLNDPYAYGWEYSVFAFVLLNTACLVVTTCFYGRLFLTIKRTRLSTPIELNETKMAMRLFLMVLIDFFCWVPVIFMKMATFRGYQVDPEMHAWVILIVLNLNAGINPLVYTFSTTRLGIKFVQLFIRVTHLGKYASSYYDGTQFTATTTTTTSDEIPEARWNLDDWKYDENSTLSRLQQEQELSQPPSPLVTAPHFLFTSQCHH